MVPREEEKGIRVEEFGSKNKENAWEVG